MASPKHEREGTDRRFVPSCVASEAHLPELSVVIPTLNEAATLPLLLADLAAQTGIALEVVVSDGGSTDGTRDVAAAVAVRQRIASRIVTGEPGRGRQLNRGAVQACGEWLLFLHADCRLQDRQALSGSLAVLRRAADSRTAGHFRLRFDLPDEERAFGYYLCEVKARAELPGTIHGDQGFLLTRTFFAELGGFREDLPVLEDTLLAEAVRGLGRWLLLPATVLTSPRRFRVEGFAGRQTVNALLMNFAMIGWNAPLQRAPDVYRVQHHARTLEPAPFFRMVDALLTELPPAERLRLWSRTGGFVRDNAWQLLLCRSARRAYTAGLPPDNVALAPILSFRRRFDFMTDHLPGRLAAALLTWLWFRTRRRGSA